MTWRAAEVNGGPGLVYVDGAGGAPEAIPDFTEIDYALSGPMTPANIYEQCMTFAAKAVEAGAECVLVVGFESADHALDAPMARALELCRDHGGDVPDGAGKTRRDDEASREGAAGAWRLRRRSPKACTGRCRHLLGPRSGESGSIRRQRFQRLVTRQTHDRVVRHAVVHRCLDRSPAEGVRSQMGTNPADLPPES